MVMGAAHSLAGTGFFILLDSHENLLTVFTTLDEVTNQDGRI
jgi:hypothetical protein